MIEVNLLPEELRKKEMPRLALPQVPIKGQLAIIVAFLVAHALFLGGAIYRQAEMSTCKGQIDQLRIANQRIMAQKAEVVQTQARMHQIEAVTERKFYWVQLLNSLSDVMVKGVWLNTLSVSDKGEGMRGAAAGGVGGASKNAKAAAKNTHERNKVGDISMRFFKIEGSAVGGGQETAMIGKFIKEIKGNQFFSSLLADVELANINQRRIREVDVYDFLLEARVRPEKVDFA